MMLKAVAGEVIDRKGYNEENAGEAGEFYPAGHSWRVVLIHEVAFVVSAKFKGSAFANFAKAGKHFANPGILFASWFYGDIDMALELEIAFARRVFGKGLETFETGDGIAVDRQPAVGKIVQGLFSLLKITCNGKTGEGAARDLAGGEWLLTITCKGQESAITASPEWRQDAI